MRLDRLLAIIVQLLNKDKISAKELADKFEVSVRTIYRDIDAINLAGIPIVAYPGNNGGFGIMENYKLDKQLLTLKDMCSVLSALKGINTTLENRELDTAIHKIRNLVPKEKVSEVELHSEQLIIDIMPWGYTQRQKELLKTLNQAIQDSRQLEFSYNNAKGEQTIRRVEPMTLLFKGYAWYLFAFCLQKNDYRLFRLSRMKEVHACSDTFIRRKKSYQEYDSIEVNKEQWVTLTLKFLPEVKLRVEDFFDENSLSIQEDQSVVVTIELPENEWVYTTILSYGENVEVLAPQHVRNIIQEKAQKIALLYQT